MRDELLRIDGITQVNLDSVRRYEIAIEELVLRDVPPELADGLGPAVQEHLAALAAGTSPAAPTGQAATTDNLAGRIAHAVWDSVRSGGAA